MNTNDIVFIAIILNIGLIAYLTIPRFFTRRYVPWVIKVFEEHKAINAESALPADRLLPIPFAQHIFRRRDFTYKRMALEALIRSNIVKSTADGRLFLVRENLHAYGLDREQPRNH